MESRSVRRSLLLLSRAHLLLRHNYNKPSLSNPLSQIQTLKLPLFSSSSSSSFTISNHNLLFFSHSRSFCSSFEPNHPLNMISNLGRGGGGGGGGVNNSVVLDSSSSSAIFSQGEPVKRKPGRPPGSGKKKKMDVELESSSLHSQPQKRGRGRPPGSASEKKKEPTTVPLLFDYTTSHEHRVQWLLEQHAYLMTEGERIEEIIKCLKKREQWLEKERKRKRKLDDVRRMEQWWEEQREQCLKEMLWNNESQQGLKKLKEQCLKELIGLREKREQCFKRMMGLERAKSLMELEESVEEILETVEWWEEIVKDCREVLEMDYDALKSKDIDWIYSITILRKKNFRPEAWNSIQQDGENKDSSDEGDLD